ncbi:MAG: hypothetical protein ACRDL7_04235 [Gaiellaceae bacterium]
MVIPVVNPNIQGSFVPTTFIMDVASLQEVDVNSEEFKELLVRLYQNLNRIVLSLNIKTSGYYDTNQFVDGSLWFPSAASSSLVNTPYRPETRLVVNFGALPNTGSKSVAHGITCNGAVSFTRIYGAATDPINFKYIPLDYASPTAANNIELKVDATNVTVITGSDRTAFTTTYIVLEFLTAL